MEDRSVERKYLIPDRVRIGHRLECPWSLDHRWRRGGAGSRIKMPVRAVPKV